MIKATNRAFKEKTSATKAQSQNKYEKARKNEAEIEASLFLVNFRQIKQTTTQVKEDVTAEKRLTLKGRVPKGK